MRRQAVPFALGTAVGVAATLMYSQWLGSDRELDVTRKALAKSEEKLRQERQATEALKVRTSEIVEVASAPVASKVSGSPLADLANAQIQQMYDGKIAAMKARLKLTPDQEAFIRDAYRREQAKIGEMTGKILAGGKADPTNAPPSSEKLISQILTPEQAAEYQAMKKQERANQIEMTATYEMNQLAAATNLSEEQKDEVFGALAKAEEELATPEGMAKYETKDSSQPADPLRYLDIRRQAKIAALKDILTEEQLAVYQEQLKAHAALMRQAVRRVLPQASPSP